MYNVKNKLCCIYLDCSVSRRVSEARQAYFSQGGNWGRTTQSEIDFLDLTILIYEKNHIMTKTNCKPQNIYLYIPQRSATHPGNGIIFGCMRRYRLQNSLRKDYLEQINLSILISSTCRVDQQKNWNMILVYHRNREWHTKQQSCFHSSTISSLRTQLYSSQLSIWLKRDNFSKLLHFPDHKHMRGVLKSVMHLFDETCDNKPLCSNA